MRANLRQALAGANAVRKTCPSNADKSSGRRMSLKESQYGGCSICLQHPDRYLGRLRTISRLHVYLVDNQKPANSAITSRRRREAPLVWRRTTSGKARVSLPNNREAPKYRCRSGRDADLEAFSHSPTDVASHHWPLDQARVPNVRT